MAPITVPEILALPRPSAATANPSGTRAIWPSSTFDFEAADGAGRTEKAIHLVELTESKATPSLLLSGIASETAWISDDVFLHLRSPTEAFQPLERSDKSHKALVKAANADSAGVEIWGMHVVTKDQYKIGELPVAISNLKIIVVSADEAILAFSAVVFPDGDIYKVAEHKKRLEKEARGSEVRVYEGLFTRHWDEWEPTNGELTQLHFVRLSRNRESFDDFEVVEKSSADGSESNWRIVTKVVETTSTQPALRQVDVCSPLAGTRFECPVGPFGSSSDYSLSSTHLLFHAKSIHLNPAFHTRTQVHLVPLSPKSKNDSIQQITVGTQGACANPTFSRDGSRVAWLEMREDGYEADRHRIMIYEVESGKRWEVPTSEWDRSPSSIEWCPCGAKIYVTAEDRGHVKLYQIPIPVDATSSSKPRDGVTPEQLTSKHSVTSFSPLSNDKVLLTINSLTSPNTLSVLDLSATKDRLTPLASLTPDLKEKYGLDSGSEFTFAGAEGKEVHGWAVLPPDYDESRTYPLAFLVHGGPQGAWNDSWSTRWNPNAFAAAGYITIAINPTGSTGYGQEFCDAIKNHWGGRPFQDLVAGLEYVKKRFPIDEKRMAALGASYGGYMTNWIQGHNDVTKFAALVCHDGVFSTTATFFATDELYFPEREFGGVPWITRDAYEKWNPQNHISKWCTPQLVIHGGQDFRLPVSEGLGVFNTLQRLGIPSRFVYFESENHWILNPHNGIRWHEEVFKWIDHWTAAEAPKSGNKVANV